MQTLRRLEELTKRAEDRPRQAMIAEAVDVIVHLKMNGLKREVEQITAVEGEIMSDSSISFASWHNEKRRAEKLFLLGYKLLLFKFAIENKYLFGLKIFPFGAYKSSLQQL